MGWLIACGPAVPADTESAGPSGNDETFSDSLPPLTSTTMTPVTGSASPDGTTTWPGEILDVYLPPTGGVDDRCETGWTVHALHPAVVLVVDTSSSMVTNMVDHDADPLTEPVTRWHAVVNALEQGIPLWNATHDLGLVRFPTGAVDPPAPEACTTGVGVLGPEPLGAGDVIGALPSFDDLTLAGASPLRGALSAAANLFAVADPGAQRFVVVVTDGAPNCIPGLAPPASFDQLDTEVAPLLATMASEGIASLVVGMNVVDADRGGTDGDPFTNPRDALDQMASAGGLFGSALLADDIDGMVANLDSVPSAMPSRRLRIPAEALSYGFYEVQIGGTLWGEAFDCGRDHGYRLVDTGGEPDTWDTMELCGQPAVDLASVRSATIFPVCAILE